MRRVLTGAVTLAMLCTLGAPAAAAGAEGSYTFSILVNGSNSAIVERGENVTVTLTMTQDGETGNFDLYSMQDYVCFDPDYFTYVEDSLEVYTVGSGMAREIFYASAIAFPEGEEQLNRVYVNRATSQVQEIPSGVTVLTFELEPIQNGTTEITHDTIEVFRYSGNLFPAAGEDATVTIGNSGTVTPDPDPDEPEEPDTPDPDEPDDPGTETPDDPDEEEPDTPSGGGGGGGGGGGAAAPDDEEEPEETPEETPEDETQQPSQSAGSPFVDVPGGAWYEDAVDYVYRRGLMSGTSANEFSPDVTTSRAMLVMILYRLAGSPAVDGTPFFTDVEAGAWYAQAVNWASANGIVDGYGEGLFGPNDPVTREQMAVILQRYCQYAGVDVTNRSALDRFADSADVAAWSQEAVEWAVADGLISGTDANLLLPGGDATRAQAAQILMSLCENVLK